MFQNYLAAALRNLARNGQYAGITIAGLAIAFAAAILIGLYVRDEMSYDSWAPGHEQVFLVRQKITGALAKPIVEETTPGAITDLIKLDFPQIQVRCAAPRRTPFRRPVRRGDIQHQRTETSSGSIRTSSRSSATPAVAGRSAEPALAAPLTRLC